MLKTMETNGQIKDLRSQHKVLLSDAEIGYKVDFSYEDSEGNRIWVEAKGAETEPWRLKKKLWRVYGPGPLLIYKGSWQRPVLTEEVVPKKKVVMCPGCAVRVEEK